MRRLALSRPRASPYSPAASGLKSRPGGLPPPDAREAILKPMNDMAWSIRAVLPLLVAGGLASASGCTSALSTAYLRDAIWDSAGHAAEDEPDAAPDELPEAEATDVVEKPPAAAEFDAERRAAAIDEAVARLARIGRLDEAAKATLVETLQQTAQEDWPVVVAAFAESLEASAAAAHEAVAAVADAEPPQPQLQPHVAAKPEPDQSVVPAPEPPPLTVANESPAAVVATDVDSAATPAPESPAALPPAGSTPAPEPAVEPSFGVRHACFASRVRAWGDVDRFPESRFTPGQEVIVYLELDHLSAGASPAGHTTCIDATLTLLDADGHAIREWSFEPIAETCPTPRHDYFARYVIRMPESVPPGGCRLAVAVVDTLAGRTASTTLPLEVVPRQVAAR